MDRLNPCASELSFDIAVLLRRGTNILRNRGASHSERDAWRRIRPISECMG
jgi:hypothetical protein